MISIFQRILSPLLKAFVKKAQHQHQAALNPSSTVWLARALSWAGRASEAYSVITTGRRSFPGDARIRKTYAAVRDLYARALLAKTLGALKHDPKIENYIRAADLQRTLGQWRKALSLLERARDAFPDHWGIEFSVGQLYFSRYKQSNDGADLANCLQSLRLARDLNPDHYKVLFFLALTCTRASMYSEAVLVADAILETIPGDQKALALKTHIERARAAAARLGNQEEASSGAEPPSKRTAASDAAEEAAEKLIERVTGEIPEAVGAFALSESGTLLGGQTRDNVLFDFSKCNDAVASMATSCRNDTDRIGIGTLQSCVLSGDSWQVVIRTVDDMSLVAFLEGTTAAPGVEALTNPVPALAS